jgi:putative transposase
LRNGGLDADLVTVVPDRIDRVSKRDKALPARCVLDAKAESLVFSRQLVFGFVHSGLHWDFTSIFQIGLSMELRTGRHVVFMLHAHLVFTTKRRGMVLTQEYLHRLEEIFRDVCADFEVELREFNGEGDHVHFLINYPPKVRLSELVNSLKCVSSRRLQQEFPAIKAFWSVRKSRGVLWTPSYFAGSVGGAPLSVLKQYIEQHKDAATSSR